MSPEKWIAGQIKDHGLKQGWLARKINIGGDRLSYYLNEKRHMPAWIFLALCKELRISPAKFLEDVADE